MTLTIEEVLRASEEWGANCGPTALAAITGRSLDDVRPHLAGFDAKRYTNPTMMYDALRSLGVNYRKVAADWPQYGLVRVQWEGPWTEPEQPWQARQRHTHWVGGIAADGAYGYGVFDVNCIGNGTGWVDLHDWETIVVPYLIQECAPKEAYGTYHITHALEIPRP